MEGTTIQFVSVNDIIPIITQAVKEQLELSLKRQSEEKLLTVKEVCSMLSITRPTLDKWDKEGILRKRNVGNKILYKYLDVQAAIQMPIRYKR